MGVALIQTKKGNGGGYVNSYNTVMDGNPLNSNKVIVIIGCGVSDTPTITGLGGSWTRDKTQSDVGLRKIEVWRCEDPSGSNATVTVTFGVGQFSDSAIEIREYSGLSSSAIDQVGGQNNTAATSHPSGSTPTLSQANELVFIAMCIDGDTSSGVTGDAGYNTVSTQKGFDAFTGIAVQDKTVAATTAVSGTMTTSTNKNSSVLVTTYKIATVAGNSNFFAFF